MRLVVVMSAAFLASVSLPDAASGQAIVGPENSASFGVSYQLGKSDRIIESQGFELQNYKTTHHALTIAGDYATPLEGLAIEAQMDFVGAKWDDSSEPHFPSPGPWDDGDLHFSPTDLRAGLRYQFLREPLNMAVSLAGSVPTTDYPVRGLTAPGRGLKALHLGLAAARTLDPILPNLYLAGSYEFSLVEKFDEVPGAEELTQNRSDFAFQVGYFLGERLEIHGAFDGRIHHGGVDFVRFMELTDELEEFHDPILREQALWLGGGLGYAITDAFSLGLEARLFVSGKNTRDTDTIGLGASYQFL